MLYEYNIDTNLRVIIYNERNTTITNSANILLREFIDNCYSDCGSIRAIAGRLGKSVRTLERTCNHMLWIKPVELQSYLRVGISGLLLIWRSDLSIAGVASICGYKSSTSLRRQYRDKLGMTPSDFIEHCKNNDCIPSFSIHGVKGNWHIPSRATTDTEGVMDSPITFQLHCMRT